MEYKHSLCHSINANNIGEIKKNGFSQTMLYQFGTGQHPEITKIAMATVSENINQLTELGLALWFYDDGSLHQTKHFYNLSTHAFDLNTQISTFLPFFTKYAIYPTIAYDRKKDGRMFTYLRINKTKGANIINDLLHSYPIKSLSYKTY